MEGMDRPAFGSKMVRSNVYDNDRSTFEISGGMTLREWYAGMALQGTVANSGCPLPESRPLVVEWCFKLADEMMKEAEKRK